MLTIKGYTPKNIHAHQLITKCILTTKNALLPLQPHFKTSPSQHTIKRKHYEEINLEKQLNSVFYKNIKG